MSNASVKGGSSEVPPSFKHDLNDSDQNAQKRKRLRAVLVCTYCRRRKVKCDRKQPCSRCIRMNIADTCSYEAKVEGKSGDGYIMELQIPLDKETLSKRTEDSGMGVSSLFLVEPKTMKNPEALYVPQHTGLYNVSATTTLTQVPHPNPDTIQNNSIGTFLPPGLNSTISRVATDFWGTGNQNTYTRINSNMKMPMGRGMHPQSQFSETSFGYQQKSFPGGAVDDGSQSIESNTRSVSEGTKLESQSLDSQQSEIEMLKQRLQQIEKSLVGASTSSKPVPPSPAPLQPMLKNYSLSQRQDFGNYLSPNTAASFSTGLTPLPHVGPGGEDGVNSMLPPLNSSFKFSNGSQSPPPPTLNPYPVSSYLTRKSLGERYSMSTSASSTNDSQYQLSPATTNTSVKSESSKDPVSPTEDFMLGTNIYSSPGDTINFYEFYSSVNYKDSLNRSNFGPFAWTSLMKRDPALRALWDHFSSLKENSKDESAALGFPLNSSANQLSVERTTALLDANSNMDENRFHKRALEADGYEEIVPYNCILEAKKKQALNESTLPLGLTFYDGQIGPQLQLIEKIQVVLPTKKVVWKLIYRFFAWVYPYCPFLDEGYFRRDVANIIGPESYKHEPIPKIKIEKKLDLATMGILLIVLRYSYLSLFSNNSELNELTLKSNDPDPKVQEMKYLMLNPININTIDVAELCLEQFKLLRRTSFTVLQLALYIRLYHTYAPEDGDGADGGDSQVLNSVLLQMAYSLGLNREPDENCPDLRIKSLSRKIWQYLVFSDLLLGCHFGNPLTTDTMYYDTKVPFHVPGGENLIDKERDQEVSERFGLFSDWHDNIRKLLKLTLSVRDRTSVPELCAQLSAFESKFYNSTGTLRDALKRGNMGELSIINRNFTTKVYLGVKSLCLTLYFHLYLYYETKDPNVAFFYYKKCLLISISDIMPHYETLICKSEVISDMIINPTLELVVHRATLVLLSAIVRVNSLIYHMRMKPDHGQKCNTDKPYLNYFQKLCQLSSGLTRATEYSISAIGKISNRYYYAWRIAKGLTFMLKTVTSANFFESIYDKSQLFQYIKFTGVQVDEIINLCEATLSQFRDSSFCTYGFTNKANNQLLKFGPGSISTQMPGGSEGSTNPLGQVTSTEVDKVWLQVLSMKYDHLLNEKYREAPEGGLSAGSFASQQNPGLGTNLNVPGAGASDFDRYGFDIEMANRYDCFSEMPFEKFFNF